MHDHIHSCTKEYEEEAISWDSKYLIWRLTERSKRLQKWTNTRMGSRTWLGIQHQVYPVRDDEVLVDSEEIESKPDLRKDQMKRQLLGLEDRCHEKTRS